ncbi:MAG: SpoIIE family protein phosphatase [Clostridia bacterium]|nr:SpoIIE family protein phosphatase [Clostridia bacterium]
MEFVSKMIGTLAVILLISALLGGGDMLSKYERKQKRLKYILLAGLVGGLFGIYGNITGVDVRGAVITVRDIGPMLAGITGGPLGGLIAGVIAGAHRYTMGGITANACIVATCCIGLICGFISMKFKRIYTHPFWAFVVGALSEALHLGIVLLMVKPFETALDIVKQVALPFIAINAIGFTLMVSIIVFFRKQRIIILERNRLHSELEVAAKIQKSLLPRISDTYPGREEFSVRGYMQPAKEVGGDFYDFFFIDKDHMAFVIADVSGKGVPAAIVMTNAKTILQNCLRDFSDFSEAVSVANNSLCTNNEADMFVTAWIGILDIPSGDMRYISAGHNPPVLMHGHKAIMLASANSFVLAGMEDVRYKEHRLHLAPGDKLFMYTDGVVESQTSSKELFGDNRLLECIEENIQKDAGGVIDAVEKSLKDFVADAPQFDDTTMLCVEMKQSPTGVEA